MIQNMIIQSSVSFFTNAPLKYHLTIILDGQST